MKANDPPCARYGHSANIHGAEMFVFGGTDGTSYYNDLYVFHLSMCRPRRRIMLRRNANMLQPASLTWRKIHEGARSDLWPSPRAHHHATVRYGALGGSKHLFVCGGEYEGSDGGKSNVHHDIWRLDLGTY